MSGQLNSPKLNRMNNYLKPKTCIGIWTISTALNMGVIGPLY